MSESVNWLLLHTYCHVVFQKSYTNYTTGQILNKILGNKCTIKLYHIDGKDFSGQLSYFTNKGTEAQQDEVT